MRFALVVLAASISLPAGKAPLTVSAAISLTNVLETLGRMYSQQGGGDVRFNFAASNTLARQIANGAPVDVFISADEAQMDIADKSGAIAAGTRVKLLGNGLVAVRRLDKPHGGGLEMLARQEYRRIAIGDPEAVPAGVYAKAWIMRAGLWEALQRKLVPVANVRAALAAVDNGGADAAFAYTSDLASYMGQRLVSLTSTNWPSIVYPAAIVKSSRNQAEASRFLKFLCGSEAAAVFEQHRFTPLGCR